MTPTGVGAAPLPSLNTAIRRVLVLLYAGIPGKPVTIKHLSKADRNAELRARYAAGEILEKLAAQYGISLQRIHQIIHFRQR